MSENNPNRRKLGKNKKKTTAERNRRRQEFINRRDEIPAQPDYQPDSYVIPPHMALLGITQEEWTRNLRKSTIEENRKRRDRNENREEGKQKQRSKKLKKMR